MIKILFLSYLSSKFNVHQYSHSKPCLLNEYLVESTIRPECSSKVQTVSLSIQYDSTRSNFIQVTNFSQLKVSSYRFKNHFDSISNEDSEYCITSRKRP